jgi:hypothetical protein
MQASCDSTRPAHRFFYRVADQAIQVDALDLIAADLIRKIFAEWYLVPENAEKAETPAAVIRIRSGANAPAIPAGWRQFEIAADAACHTNGDASYIEIQDSVVAIGAPGLADVEIWTNASPEDDFPVLVRLISHALSSGLRRCGLFELHSAAVVEPASGDGVLIIGPSGSGKSTLAVQLSAEGWPYLSDDVLLLGSRQDYVEAWALRRCFAVTTETMGASEFLQTRVRPLPNGNREKDRFSPHDIFASEFKQSCTPRKLVFSQVTGAAQSSLSLLVPSETMARLIRMSPWSCYDSNTARRHLQVFSGLVRQSQGYALFAGRDLLAPGNSSRFLASCLGN